MMAVVLRVWFKVLASGAFCIDTTGNLMGGGLGRCVAGS